MKVRREGNKFLDEYGEEITWRSISEVTDLNRGRARILLKKLAEAGEDVPIENLREWRDDMALIWSLENIHNVSLESNNK